MAKKTKKAKKTETVGAFDDIKDPDIYDGGMTDTSPPEPKPVKKEPVKKEIVKPKTWPFHKDKIPTEKADMQHIARRINQKYNAPGMKTITKTVVFDCEKNAVVCKDYDIEY